jgi:exonuclease VII large subunit
MTLEARLRDFAASFRRCFGAGREHSLLIEAADALSVTPTEAAEAQLAAARAERDEAIASRDSYLKYTQPAVLRRAEAAENWLGRVAMALDCKASDDPAERVKTLRAEVERLTRERDDAREGWDEACENAKERRDAYYQESVRAEAAERDRDRYKGERDIVCKSFEELCDELGCPHDNEAALLAADKLKRECNRYKAALEAAGRIANGRDNLDGFPRGTDEKQRRLAAIVEHVWACIPAPSLPVEEPQPADKEPSDV